jgi:hypothetical protein
MDVGTRATAAGILRPSAHEDHSGATQKQPVTSVLSAQNQALLAQQSEVRKLVARDREVRAHEAAHAAVGGAHAGNPNFQFTPGPNGQRYATSGHVNIDISPVKGDPGATLAKMQTVARAALAPAEPSAADRAVAAKANVQAARARAELAQQAQADTDPGLFGAIDKHQEPGSVIDVIV